MDKLHTSNSRYPYVGLHPCNIDIAECWPQLQPEANIIQRAIRSWRKAALPSYYHPQTKYAFKSMYRFREEKTRMIYHCSPCVIHPYSILSALRDCIAFFLLYMYLFIESFRIYYFMYRHVSYVVVTLKFVHLIFLISDMFMGYVDYVNEQRVIILNLAKIRFNTIKTFWFIEVFDVLRLFVVLVQNEMVVLWLHMVIFHIYSAYKIGTCKYLQMVLILIGMQHKYHNLTKFIVHVILFVHYSTCVMYGLPRLMTAMVGDPDPDLETYIRLSLNEKIYLYMRRLHLVMLYLFRSTNHFRMSPHPYEKQIEQIVSMLMFILSIYTFVFVLLTFKNMNQAEVKYGYMWTNIFNFLQSRNITGKLRYKILAHYQYKFQYKYFDESVIIRSLSTHLQYENRLHTSSHLIVNVSLLRGLPRMLVGRIIAELHPVIFMPNDIILKGKNPFDGIFFISYGTVAFYHTNGKEIMHLEDGGVLGVIGSYTGYTTVTVTSVTITELYKWNVQDVNNMMAICPELANRIKLYGKDRLLKLLKEETRLGHPLNQIWETMQVEGKHKRPIPVPDTVFQ